MDAVTGRYNQNYINFQNQRNSNQRNNLSFGKNASVEVQGLIRSLLGKRSTETGEFVRGKNYEAGKLLTYLANSSNKRIHPGMRALLEDNSVFALRDHIENILEDKDKIIAQYTKNYRILKTSLTRKPRGVLKKLKRQVQDCVLGALGLKTSKSKVNQQKIETVRAFMPDPHKLSEAQCLRIFNSEKFPSVAANLSFLRDCQTAIEKSHIDYLGCS